MSETVVIALVGLFGTVLVAVIGAWATMAAAGKPVPSILKLLGSLAFVGLCFVIFQFMARPSGGSMGTEAPESPPISRSPPPATQPPTQPAPTQAPILPLDISGVWLSQNGYSYHISQNNNQIHIQEVHPLYGITAQGEGIITDHNVTITYTATDGNVGKGVLIISENQKDMSGTFTSLITGVPVQVVLVKN